MYTLNAELTMEDLMQVASGGEVPEAIKRKLVRAAESRIAVEWKNHESPIARKPKKFQFTVTSTEVFELTDDQIFADGIPEDACAADVKRAIKDYGTVEEVIHDWNLITNPEWDIRVKQTA